MQCIAERAVCRDVNRREGHDIDLYGIVSSGQVWIFYRLTTDAEVHVSDLFTTSDLPRLLGVLEQMCAACAENISA